MTVRCSPGSFARQATRGLALSLSLLMTALPVAAQDAKGTGDPAAHSAKSTVTRRKTPAKHTAPVHHHHRSTRQTASRAVRTARTARIRQAFVASTELRPMAQQLALLRTPEAYAGVTAYAHGHTGETAAAAYLALGHAYLLDNRFADAAANLRQARAAGDALADYDEYLGAKAEHDGGNNAAAEELLKGFAERN